MHIIEVPPPASKSQLSREILNYIAVTDSCLPLSIHTPMYAQTTQPCTQKLQQPNHLRSITQNQQTQSLYVREQGANATLKATLTHLKTSNSNSRKSSTNQKITRFSPHSHHIPPSKRAIIQILAAREENNYPPPMRERKASAASTARYVRAPRVRSLDTGPAEKSMGPPLGGVCAGERLYSVRRRRRASSI